MGGVRSSLGLYTRQNVRQLRWRSRSPHSRQIQPLLNRRGARCCMNNQYRLTRRPTSVISNRTSPPTISASTCPRLRCRWSPTTPAQPTRRWLTWKKCETPKWCTQSPPKPHPGAAGRRGDVPGAVRYALIHQLGDVIFISMGTTRLDRTGTR